MTHCDAWAEDDKVGILVIREGGEGSVVYLDPIEAKKFANVITSACLDVISPTKPFREEEAVSRGSSQHDDNKT